MDRKPKPGYKLVKWYFGKEIEIPEDWSIKKLNELCDVRQGLQIPISERFREPKSNRFRYITVRSVHSNSFDEYIENPSKRVICTKDDVLFTRTGNTGEIITNVEGVFHNNFFLIDFDRKITDKNYLIIFLEQQRIQEIIMSLAGSTTIPDLNHGDFFRLMMTSPTLSEQQKIASILSNVDDLITKYDSIINSTKVLKHGLMQQLLTKGIGHTKFKSTEFGVIPETWTLKQLQELGKVERGKFMHRPRDDPRFYGGNYPFIQTGDVERSNGIISRYSQTLNEEGLKISKMFPTNTIVITIAANIGSTAITSFPVCFPDSLVGISCEGINVQFLHYFLRSRKQFLNNLATNSAQKNINLETLKPLLIPVPPKEEQQRIASTLSSTDEKISELESKKSSLEKLKKGLMQKLLTGQIRVKAIQ